METSQGKRQRASSSDSEDIPRPDPKRAFTSAIDLHPVAETMATGKSLDDLDAKLERVIQGQDAMNQRMQNLAQDIAQVVDTKLNALRQEIESKFGDFGAELQDVRARLQTLEDRHSTPPDEDAIAAIRDRLDKVESGATNTSNSTIYPTLLIKGLIETNQETMGDLLSKCQDLIDQLQLQVEVTSAERIGSTDRGRNKNRPVAVTFRTNDDIKLVMKNKRKLKDNATYSAVYIDHDKPRDIRSMEANIRRLVKQMPNIEIRRGRVVSKPNPDAENNAEA